MAPSSSFTQLHTRKMISGSLDKHDCGLRGLDGAELIIQHLRFQRPDRLILSHNELGNEGCVALFEYLCSNEGRYRHNIEEISLNANAIGDKGLLAIAKYLDGNKSLGSLYLQNNEFKGDRFVMLRFTVALNRSNLHTLSLTSNVDLGDALSDTFLPNLSALNLIELHLSVCSLGPLSVPPLLSYLCSPRAVRLFTLKLNGNNFGLEGVETIFNSLVRHNWSLIWLEMHACGINQNLIDANNNSIVWKDLEGTLRNRILLRNRHLANQVAWEALGLLHHARPALLLPRRQQYETDVDALHETRRSNLDDRDDHDSSGPTNEEYDSSWKVQKVLPLVRKSTKPSDFVSARQRLPLELVLHILGYLAPSLSPAQFRRVCAFAEDRTTLPSLSDELSLPASSSLSRVFSVTAKDDLSGSAQSRGGLNPYLEFVVPSSSFVHGSGTIRLFKWKHPEQRKFWLKVVGCDRYEPGSFTESE